MCPVSSEKKKASFATPKQVLLRVGHPYWPPLIHHCKLILSRYEVDCHHIILNIWYFIDVLRGQNRRCQVLWPPVWSGDILCCEWQFISLVHRQWSHLRLHLQLIV